jgi:hypothetical protein
LIVFVNVLIVQRAAMIARKRRDNDGGVITCQCPESRNAGSFQHGMFENATEDGRLCGESEKLKSGTG